jgi:GntR family transcriptional regulator, histidine utilization repressor
MSSVPTLTPTAASDGPVPHYLRVKNHILQKIESGDWPVSGRIPSESEIVRKFGISRMTANRAFRELQSEGWIHRVAGSGSFVAPRTPQTHPLEVHGIADEIRARGHVHRAGVIVLRRTRAGARLAQEFGVLARDALYCSAIVHFENDVPIMLEDRHVLPSVCPGYLEADFERETPYDLLMRSAPLQLAEHVIRAVIPDERVRRLLQMKKGEPCLLTLRRTWSGGSVASVARLHYPGSRYEMSGRFRPGS